MKIAINGNFYEMPKDKCKGFLAEIKENYEKGIYAVKKGDYVECRNDKFKSKKELFAAVSKWNAKGFVAYWVW